MTTTRVILTPWRTKLAAKFGGSDKQSTTTNGNTNDTILNPSPVIGLRNALYNGNGNDGDDNDDEEAAAERQQLADAVAKIARKELREDRSARDQCTEQMRAWLAKCEDVSNVRTDDEFLLRFLRVKKFSVPMAQQMLLKYLNLKRIFPEFTTQLDYQREPMNRVFANGYLVVSPIRDQHGRRVMIITAGNFDPHTFNSAAQAKAHFITLETLLADPHNQVLGFTHVLNMAGVTAAHVTNWNPKDFSRSLRWGEQSWPARHKGVHCCNVPSAVKFVMDFARSKLSAKMRDRFQAHGSFKELHRQVDPACLPAELGGSGGTLAEMNALWHRELKAAREELVALDAMVLHSDANIVTTKREKEAGKAGGAGKTELQAHVDSVAGSFRKLEFD